MMNTSAIVVLVLWKEVRWLSHVVNGKWYTGVSGDDAKKAANDIYSRGERIDHGNTNCSDLFKREVQKELDKLEYLYGKKSY